MIHFLTGVPGSGKGVVATEQIIRELTRGSRVILTDMALRMEPWVRDVSAGSLWGKAASQKRFQAELGLLAYLVEKFGDDFSASERVFVLGDGQSKEFYLRRYDRKLKQWVLVDADRDEKGRVQSFDTLRQTHGALVITDEFWASYGSRDWQETGKGVIFYAAQHRKFGDEWFIVCQHPKQVETQLRMLAHDTWICSNHAKIPLGPFRRPNKFTIAIYDKIPSGPSATPLERRVLTLDKRGLGGCFDTAAGSGVVGGGAADLNERKRGLPFWVLIVCVIAIIAGLSQVPKLVNLSLGKFLSGKKSPAPNAGVVVVTNSAPVVNSPHPISEGIATLFGRRGSTNGHDSVKEEIPWDGFETNKVCGVANDGKKLRYILSDGTIRIARQNIRLNEDGTYEIDGKKYRTASVEPGPAVSSQPTYLNHFVPEPQYTEPPKTTVTIIGERKRHEENYIPGREKIFGDR